VIVDKIEKGRGMEKDFIFAEKLNISVYLLFSEEL
jgi:hypothetical protein